MSKVKQQAVEQSINLAVSLRRKIVDCRLPRERETLLLEKASELIELVEKEQVSEEGESGHVG